MWKCLAVYSCSHAESGLLDLQHKLQILDLSQARPEPQFAASSKALELPNPLLSVGGWHALLTQRIFSLH